MDYLFRLTDRTGIIQFATGSIPDPRSGYCTDDCARALIAALTATSLLRTDPPLGEHTGINTAEALTNLAVTQLSFLRYALMPNGFFHNFLDFDRRWEDEQGADDAQGRALWALGFASEYAHRNGDEGMVYAASQMFDSALPAARAVRSPRAQALVIQGAAHRLTVAERLKDTRHASTMRDLIRSHADNLASLYRHVAGPGWFWFEEIISYDNARLPLALLIASTTLDQHSYRQIANESLSFLLEQLFPGGTMLESIGQNGWYPRHGPRAQFDQQGLEACGTVEVCLEAARLSSGSQRVGYRDLARHALAWYHGRNVLGLSLIDPTSGGCHDGLSQQGVNDNMGAESLLSYLLAELWIRREERSTSGLT